MNLPHGFAYSHDQKRAIEAALRDGGVTSQTQRRNILQDITTQVRHFMMLHRQALRRPSAGSFGKNCSAL